jgi:iron complex outermembrane recepter protein
MGMCVTNYSSRGSVQQQARLIRLRKIASCIALVLQAAAFAKGNDTAASIDSRSDLEEIIVTGNRRQETISKAPYNISAYSGAQLESAHITTLTSLSQEVPNFVIEDSGARSSESQIPIIRGLNASQPTGIWDGARFFESPVGFYLGNSPMIGALPLMDVERIEVLRGPQGTLYGSGTLAGAVRVVPIDPKLGVFGGQATISGATVSYSRSKDSDVLGVVNLPIGDTVAFRMAAKDEFDAGFIDQFNIMKRQDNNFTNGLPLLAQPGDLASSPAIYYDLRDVNWTRTTSARTAILWKPNEAFHLTAAFDYSHVYGNGSPTDTSRYGGGSSPIDPRVSLPATGPYEISSPSLEPFDRTTRLSTVDGSYDVGFATLSGTVTYGETAGSNSIDGTRFNLGTPFTVYYTGTPANPRYAETLQNLDQHKVYTEELRMVSNGKRTFDYVVGAFAQQDTRQLLLNTYNPGADTQSAAAHGGDTTPISEGGGYIFLYPGSAAVHQIVNQLFKDYALYGNVTWNVTPTWQVTWGGRLFHQTFVDQESQAIALEQSEVAYPRNSTSLTNHIFMFDSSYLLDPSVTAYVTWSQGFRRGGANSYPLTGPVAENPALLYYGPDKTNNYEVGIKGTTHGVYFSFAAFYVLWTDPQIDLQTPYFGYNAVVNGREATSKGVEFEASGPLGVRGLSFNLGFAYAKARLSENFALPANGPSGPESDGIVGFAGDRLPGAPDFSGALNLKYIANISAEATMTFSVGADYRGSTTNALPHLNPIDVISTSPTYATLHGEVALSHGRWQSALYGTNLTNKHVVYSTSLQNTYSTAAVGTYAAANTVARPREIGVRFSLNW